MAQSHSGSTDASDVNRELAEIERQLRSSSVEDVSINVCDRTARIGFNTPEPAQHHRESITGSVVTAVAETDRWEIASVHDPIEMSAGRDIPMIGSMLTIREETEESR